ncbi:serine/threonine-protein kinase RsbT [Clostridium saccharobutylicum]|uniref:Serine/threonine-protein kinase RsbT n=2 Tax=Clostridium saccharobutylicum TaxID=169679 RepID=U5MRA4_CLOSA|nr:anti-sigma regulatory factor [Clostridium saccharobutylicum]AGX43033.1 serine/threonine-protein kinase RsbT [Clostridium saccharobutylicum DSM 13864]AQR90324.1 serine/threonine-protein kinase RsbT [Clostridium saccharobutylicum]AQS00230.1 serine/threonine-protein kinase RsbT [Clostridium saccharobutylicum]AQS10029.1 serine/threonine-protein kinase RsbT [Clostridium saccharobutylicum]AQS14213.1 serine/threonine-protein kinase RsbT [Clostridium saccharobutylicum]
MICNEISIEYEKDIVVARQKAREVSKILEFGIVDQTRIITAVSELARNIFLYAQKGTVKFQEVFEDRKHGLQISFMDDGPGIEDVEFAMQGGYSKGRSMGLGMSGSKRLMDEFYVTSLLGKGTEIIIKKWL